MTRKTKSQQQIVWSASRYEHSSKYSSSEVSIRLRHIGDNNMYDYKALIRVSASSGDSYSDDRDCYCNFDGNDLDLTARQIALVTDFIGTGEMTVGKLKSALARFDEGFFDTRIVSWQHKDKMSMRVFEPTLWSGDAAVQHLSRIYARDEADAQNIVTLELIKCNRLDLLRDWISRDMGLYEYTFYNEAFVPADLDAIFAPCPANVEEEETIA